MLVVTMTTWTARINNVIAVLETIIKQTILPDIIYLNLSEEEFSYKTLPNSLICFVEDNPIVKINWVSGSNTKPFKKIFPILKYLEADDIIINIDDDMLLPKNFIESRLKDFNKYKTCISGLQSKPLIRGYAGGMLPEVHHYLGAGSVYQKKMFNNWEKLLNNEIIATNHDDAFYCFLSWLNGYTPEPCSEMDSHTLEALSKEETAIHGNVGCFGPRAATDLNIKRFKNVFNTTPYYNFFKTNTKAKKYINIADNESYLYF